ncbi:MAG TPA: radical SAM protein, partial [Polyangiaceae bacterium]|nr:radical SAM protein [Polyangiaceae bacterium]
MPEPPEGSTPGVPGPSEPDPGLGVYVHFPWCIKKCPYCDFLSIPTAQEDIPHARYADAVLAELEARRVELGERRLRSVFFGGGTPSMWKSRELGRVLRGIRATFDAGGATPEITVECNPGSLGPDKARALLDAGVNRLSIGVQALDDARLRFLGRWHDAARALTSVEAAVRSGMPRVSADLIYGVAEQTPESAAAEV